MEKQPKPQSIFGKKRKLRTATNNSVSEPIPVKVDSSDAINKNAQEPETNDTHANSVSDSRARGPIKLPKIKNVPTSSDSYVPPKKKKKKEKPISSEEMGLKYPILKNEALIKRFMQVKMTNNQKGRIRNAVKSQLVGSDNTVSADIINGKIKEYLKKPDLSISDLRRLRVLYNLLVNTLESIVQNVDIGNDTNLASNTDNAVKVNETGSVNMNDSEDLRKKKKKKHKVAEIDLVPEKGNVDDPVTKKKKRKETDCLDSDDNDTMEIEVPKKKKKNHKKSEVENLDSAETQEVKVPKKEKKKHKTSETENADNAETEIPDVQKGEKGSKRKRRKKNKKHDQERGDGENVEKDKEQNKMKGPKRYVVFVGNLPLDINQEKLTSHFSEIDEQINNIRLPKVKEGKQAIAFIELKSEPAYEMALSKNHTMLDGYNRRITVSYTKQPNSKVTDTEAKGKVAKLLALQKSGKLAGSVPMHKKRTHRRNIAKRALAKAAQADT